MGTEHYFIVSYIEGFATTGRERVAIQVCRDALRSHFDFYQVVDLEYHEGSVCVFGRMKHYREDELIKLIGSLPWLIPETVQVLVKSEHDDRYMLLDFETPEGYRPGDSWAGSGDIDVLNAVEAALAKQRSE